MEGAPTRLEQHDLGVAQDLRAAGEQHHPDQGRSAGPGAAPGFAPGATRVGGIDLNRPRMRNTLKAVLALAMSPDGFTVADLATKVGALTGTDAADYTVRQAAYDLRKLRGKTARRQTGRSRRYDVPG